jgi:hypothetical protein
MENLKITHRDGSCKLFARILSTISVFVYQGAVFYAQLTLANAFFDCSAGVCIINHIQGNSEVWLIIETCCFYLYVLATVVYIAWRQFVGVCWERASVTGDMAKVLNDFIKYASINLTWFSFNFVLCVLPPVLIFGLHTADLVIDGATSSYAPIMYSLWCMHVMHFILCLRIYEQKNVGGVDGASVSGSMDKDDAF